jgi:hypothetical protein
MNEMNRLKVCGAMKISKFRKLLHSAFRFFITDMVNLVKTFLESSPIQMLDLEQRSLLAIAFKSLAGQFRQALHSIDGLFSLFGLHESEIQNPPQYARKSILFLIFVRSSITHDFCSLCRFFRIVSSSGFSSAIHAAKLQRHALSALSVRLL